MPLRFKACFYLLIVPILLAGLAGCGGGGVDMLDGNKELPALAGNEIPSLPDSALPVFPDAQWERENPAGVSAFDNVQPGSAAISFASPGAAVNGSALEFDGDSGPTSQWGIWRWSNFQANYPIKFLIDFEIEAGGEFYVLRSNYDTGRWELVGPLPETFANDGRTTYPAGNFVSPGNSSYVAVLTTAGTDMTINEVNLLSDDDLTAPSIPQNLAVSDLLPGSFMLDWDDVDDLGLDGYNVYSGPGSSFEIGGPGVTQMNLFPVGDSEFLASGLVPNTTYNVAVSAVDLVGNESGLSAVIEATTTNDDPPGMPTGLTIDSIGSETVNLSWTAPGDPDIQGYNIYIGDTLDFDLGDGMKQEGALYPGTSGVREGLTPDTAYFARVTAVDVFNSEGEPSASVGFTTVLDAPPVPDFLVSPGHVEKGETTFFNPSATFDPDTDSSELTFEWDFNDDDVVDETTVGPSTVSFAFPDLGFITVTLTVSDASSSVDKEETVQVNRSYERINLGNGKGTAGGLFGVASHAETNRVAIAFRDDSNTLKLRYYNGTNWSVITMPDMAFADLAVSPDGPAALYVDTTANSITWSVQRYTGSWSTIASNTINAITDPITETGQLAVADNGRFSVGLVYYPKPGFGDPSKRYHVWHQQADTSLMDVDIFSGTRTPAQHSAHALTRNDTTTYVLDNLGTGTALDLFTLTDGNTSEQSGIQTINGKAVRMHVDLDPDDDSQVFWALLTTTDRIYYGDNYGTANGGSQFVDPGSDISEFCGVGLTADNESLVYWIDSFSSGFEELKGYTTSSSTEHSIGSGIGFASGSYGAFTDTGSSTGVWVGVKESRDGEVIARFMTDDTVTDSLIVHEPTQSNSVFTKAAPVVFADQSLYSLHSQGYATALAGSIPADHSSSSTLFVGVDAEVTPLTSCITGNAGEYMVAGISTLGTLVVNTLQKGLTGATQTLVVEDVGIVSMEYSSVSDSVMLVYTSSANQAINCRIFSVGSWGGETSIVPAGDEIMRLDTAVRADGEFGLVYATDADNLFFRETSGNVWGSATNIYSGTLKLITSFIGLDYNTSNAAAVVANRDGSGAWVGVIPDGGAVSWEEADPMLTSDAYSLNVAHSSAGEPVLVYLRSDTSFADADLYISEKIDGSWVQSKSPNVVKILGIPLGLTQDSAGNIIVSGADKSSSPKALCVILYD